MAWRNLPNAITIARVLLAAVVAPLLLADSFTLRIAAFVVFLVAAFSDLWDGYLARSRGLVTDFGKLMDPLADKLLLAATFLPFYVLDHWAEPETPFPWFGYTFPLWILLVIFGRELFITLFRAWAARRDVVIAAGRSGKIKAVFQNIFIGAVIVWYALHAQARAAGWTGRFWEGWQWFHLGFTVVALTIALILTIYSMVEYLRGYAPLVRRR
jgi:CDP-diacylglycerol---glycerol-3-phosphate 3-phosphatidyltransferase